MVITPKKISYEKINKMKMSYFKCTALEKCKKECNMA